ncbi:hypothetical protein BMETH_860_0 [methanotrophic bacterial endosymbiont of Bathymodiolus sp.]|nr:hypothetical protein BMETH_860_0 [methanotrophic bacterial endosymbiont of Bathymodiolus sp.]
MHIYHDRSNITVQKTVFCLIAKVVQSGIAWCWRIFKTTILIQLQRTILWLGDN